MSVPKTSEQLMCYVQSWHSDYLRIAATKAVVFALDLAKDISLRWEFSGNERQWTADPNFVAFRFPSTKDLFHVSFFSRNEIIQIDSLPFCTARPKTRPIYHVVQVTSPNDLGALEQYIKQAFIKRFE